MNPMKLQLLEEILSHLSDSQASGLKSILDESKKPPMQEGGDAEEALESPKEELDEDGAPKGIALEKVSLMDKPKDKMQQAIDDASQDESSLGDKMSSDDEMSDDELEELLKKLI